MTSLSLDHIIILVTPSTLHNPPTYLAQNFTITPGGTHADHLTQNKLIIFKDGSYIELIAFIPTSPGRENHWWGRKKEGSMIDFAFTSPGSARENWELVTGRLKVLGRRYEKPVKGGRKMRDGVGVKWEVTFPVLKEGEERGVLPFFCHDVTDRVLRVPLARENVEHPCGAEGVKALNILVNGDVEGLKGAYKAILGDDGKEEIEVGSLFGEGKKSIVIGSHGEGLEIGELILWGEGVEKRKRIDVEGEEGLGGIWLEGR